MRDGSASWREMSVGCNIVQIRIDQQIGMRFCVDPFVCVLGSIKLYTRALSTLIVVVDR